MPIDQPIVPLLAQRIANRMGRPFGINPFPRAFENAISAGAKSPNEVFDEIHRNNYWGSSESRSGVGSEFTFTLRYREGLSALIQARNIRKIFDAPCGDMNWMSCLIKEAGIDYIGGDISEDVIDFAARQYPELDLRVFDITSDNFPSADVWHCRDCLFHLPFAAIREALQRFVESSIPYALITSHRARIMHRNIDVGFGGFRFLDLEWAPISLPRPIARIADFTAGSDFPRYVCLWSRQQIAEALAASGAAA